MAVLICLCGERMGGSAVPCESYVLVFTKEEIQEQIGIDLVDLIGKTYTYWYCPKCKKLTLTLDETGHYYRSYSRVVEETHPEFAEVKEWQEIMFWRDEEFYNAIEENDKQKVDEFLRDHPSRYLIRLSPDEAKAFVFKPGTQEYLFTYVQDPMPDFSKYE